jgi:hypothetical protein
MAGYHAQAYSVVVVVMASPIVCSAAEDHATKPQSDPAFYQGRVLKEEISPRVSRASQLVAPGSAGGPRSPQKNTRDQEQAKASVYISPKPASLAGLHLLGFTLTSDTRNKLNLRPNRQCKRARPSLGYFLVDNSISEPRTHERLLYGPVLGSS